MWEGALEGGSPRKAGEERAGRGIPKWWEPGEHCIIFFAKKLKEEGIRSIRHGSGEFRHPVLSPDAYKCPILHVVCGGTVV